MDTGLADIVAESTVEIQSLLSVRADSVIIAKLRHRGG